MTRLSLDGSPNEPDEPEPEIDEEAELEELHLRPIALYVIAGAIAFLISAGGICFVLMANFFR